MEKTPTNHPTTVTPVFMTGVSNRPPIRIKLVIPSEIPAVKTGRTCGGLAMQRNSIQARAFLGIIESFERSGFCDLTRRGMCRDASITSISQRRQGAKDQVEMIAMHCFYYISLIHCTSSGIFSAPALSKSSTDARASLCGILRAGAKNLARQIGSIISRSALVLKQPPAHKCCFVQNVVLSSSMPRLSIDITPEEHSRLKAIAALKGQSIKDFVLNRTLGEAPDVDEMSEGDALEALSDFIKPRMEQAHRGEFSTKSFEEIRENAMRRSKR